MNEENLKTLLTQLRDNTRSTLVPASGCIPLARLVAAQSNDPFNDGERTHLASCPVCQRTLANVLAASSYRADADGNLYDAVTGKPFSFEEPLDFPDPCKSPGPSNHEELRTANSKEHGEATR